MPDFVYTGCLKRGNNKLDDREPFKKILALLNENGVTVDEIFDQGGCGLLFNLYDPDHNKIEVWSGYKGEGEGEVDKWIKSQQYE